MTRWNDNARQVLSCDQAVAGEEAHRLLEEIWRTHSRRLLSITRRITRNPEDAEDALQDTFLRALTHLGELKARSGLSGWLTRIAVNSSLMILRKRGASGTVSLEDDEDGAGSMPINVLRDPGPDPEKLVVRREKFRRLRERIAKLPALLRQPMQLQTLQEHSMKDIARICGISVSAAKSRLYNARASLSSSMQLRLIRTQGESRRRRLAS